jgi:membrane-bound ClpP family serine protease
MAGFELSELPPLGLVALVVLLLWLLMRSAGWAAHLAVWTIERFRGPEELYGDHTPAGSTVGRHGVARTDLAPRGKVFVRGELWDAGSERPVAAGEGVEIVDTEGLTLRVRPAGEGPAGGRTR